MSRFPRKTLMSALLGTMVLSGCATQDPDLGPCTGKCDFVQDGPSDDDGDRWRGQKQFESSAPYWDRFPLRLLAESAKSDGAIAPDRSVEEADVYHYDKESELLYVLNSYRGLQVIDVSNPDAPVLLGRAALDGYPIDMYQRGNQAYVLLNSLSAQSGQPDDNFSGAVLRVYDLGNPTAPIETAEFRIQGNITGSRLLATDDGASTIIYVASNVYSYHLLNTFGNRKTFVMSIDVTDPTAPVEVDTVDFDGAGWQTHVTPEAMYVAQYQWSSDITTVRYVDIADLAGDIQVRGTIGIEGRLSWGDRGELQMDHHEGHLRIASEIRQDFNAGTPRFIRVSTISTQNPDALDVVGTIDVGKQHRLLATRFSGDRAYLFHMVNKDPLEVIDLSNPAAPESMGLLEIEGFVNHIEVRGDKLLTLGVNSVTDRKVALIMFDVSDPSAPVELDRAIAGEDWTWTSANHDLDTFRIVDELGLAMLPISSSSWDDDGYHYRNWLQLFSFDFETGQVGTRGEIENIGRFRRAFPIEDRIMTFSDQRLKTVDVSNPDAPRITANLELAKNVVDFTTVGPFGVMVVADGDWSNEMVELRVVSLHDPDNSQALATVELGLPRGKLFKLDEQHLAYIATDPVAGDTVISTINFTDPLEPVVLGTFKSPELGFNRWGSRIFWSSAPTNDVTQVGDAIAMYTWPDKGENQGAKLRIVSFENRAFPHESAVVDLGTGTLVDMRSEGTKLYVTTYEPVATEIEPDDFLLGTSDPTSDAATASSLLPGSLIDPFFFRQGRVAYYLRIVDLADPNNPKVSDAVNVPGKFVGTSTIGSGDFATTIIYTTDAIPNAANAAAIDTLMLIGDEKARLLDVYGLPGGAGEVRVRGTKAYLSSSGWWSGPFFLEGVNNSTFQPSFELSVLDLGRPDTIAQAGAIDIDGATYGNLGEVKGDLAFISGGWSSLFVYDVSDPTAMQRVGKFHTLGWWSGKLHVSNDGRVYLPGGFYGLHVVDVN